VRVPSRLFFCVLGWEHLAKTPDAQSAHRAERHSTLLVDDFLVEECGLPVETGRS